MVAPSWARGLQRLGEPLRVLEQRQHQRNGRVASSTSSTSSAPWRRGRDLLLAETSSACDPDDPATVALVTERVPTSRRSTCSGRYTESDAGATGAQRVVRLGRANLIDTVGRQAAEALGGLRSRPWSSLRGS